MNEVIFLQYNNNRLLGILLNSSMIMKNYTLDWLKHLHEIIKFVEYSALERMQVLTNQNSEKMQRYADGLFKSFTTKTVAIVPAQEGMEYLS